MTETTRLQPGDIAPDFDLLDDRGGRITLKELLEASASHVQDLGQQAGTISGRVIVYVYPAAMTPGCTKQACDFRDSLPALAAEGYQVVGVSPDSPAKLGQFRLKEGLTFPLASDGEKTMLTEYGAYGEKTNYGRTSIGVIRSTFVINPDQTIAHALYNVKATGHVARLRELLSGGSVE